MKVSEKTGELVFDEAFFTTNMMNKLHINTLVPMVEDDCLANLFYIVVGTHKVKQETLYDVISSRYERASFNAEKVKTLLEIKIISGGAKLGNGKIVVAPLENQKHQNQQLQSMVRKHNRQGASERVLLSLYQCKREYQKALTHKDITSSNSECDNMENMETYSEEVEIGKKKVRITLEFPYTVDPKDADRFEHMLKEVYLNKIQKGSLQSSLQAVSFPTPRGKCEINSQGGMSHE